MADASVKRFDGKNDLLGYLNVNQYIEDAEYRTKRRLRLPR
jgi:hypothetical protein